MVEMYLLHVLEKVGFWVLKELDKLEYGESIRESVEFVLRIFCTTSNAVVRTITPTIQVLCRRNGKDGAAVCSCFEDQETYLYVPSAVAV